MIGQTLSHFKITAKLGEGGMGEVYRATDTRLKREVALKVLPAEMAASPERLERFQREAEAVASLNHPNIVTIHSVEQDEGAHFLTMELVEGESLDRALERGAIAMPRALEIAASVADALAAAHDRGIVHRDVKPANVMLTSGGSAKVLDFGLAKLDGPQDVEPIDDRTAEMPTEARPLTEEGVVMGTAPYMAPSRRPHRHLLARLHRLRVGHREACLRRQVVDRHPAQGDLRGAGAPSRKGAASAHAAPVDPPESTGEGPRESLPVCERVRR